MDAKVKEKITVKYPGKRITTNGNQLVVGAEIMMSEAGVFYPITPSTEMGENFQLAYAKGQLNAFGQSLTAIEAEGEHAAQGGAIAMSVTGKRVVNFTSGQGVVYGIEQYYHAPGKLSTMVVELGARALTKHALNVHCGHDDLYAALDTGWIITFAIDAQQAVDQAIILRRVNELSLNPGINGQDGFLTTHLERTFLKPEAGLIREFLGRPDDIIECPTEAQRKLFGPTRRRVPKMIDLENPILLGPVQNQEHYMNGVAARRNNFSEYIKGFFEEAYKEFAELTGRKYGLISTFNLNKADAVFVCLGSSAENIKAVGDHLRETRGKEIGVVHINVLRPFPEDEVIKALRGKKNVIVLERTDESLSGDNPLTRDVKVALAKGISNYYYAGRGQLEKIDPNTELPKVVTGVYGLGSRDFRPEAIIGAYEFATNQIARTDGKKISDGVNFFFLGIEHPYTVKSKETPSCLPPNSIAIRFHSVGGWGMITTGKNLGSILGEISKYVAKRDDILEEDGSPKEIIHLSANPKYGSEKKGAPTNYFLVASNERIRVNCDLHHVSVVLCCDPKIFLHNNPLVGLEEGGAFVWESAESSQEKAWQRIPGKYRQEIIDKNIQVYLLNGFAIAGEATDREDLQTRMQGNSFLGSFFKVSTFLEDYNVEPNEFKRIVHEQYKKKFGRLGEKVVASNMTVMQAGYDTVVKLEYGGINAIDTSAFVGSLIHPCGLSLSDIPSNDKKKAPIFKMDTFDKEYRSGLGYNQPASALASVGVMAAGTGATSSKYVSRRQIPIFLAENCTQCMECMVACPDSAMPSTAQDISTVLRTAINNYITDEASRKVLLSYVPELDKGCRARMNELVADKEDNSSFKDVLEEQINVLTGNGLSNEAGNELLQIIDVLPMAFQKTRAIFQIKEKKEEGSGGLFSIFINDLCKGCAACVDACGKHDALRMVPETEEINADYHSAVEFLDLLRDTPSKYLGLLDQETPQDTKAAALKMHLMIQSKYNAFAAGDGACAGCGEKSILRSVATLTETYMKPLFNRKAARMKEKVEKAKRIGVDVLNNLHEKDEASYEQMRKTMLHILLGLGGVSDEDTASNIELEFEGNNEDLIKALSEVMEEDIDKHSHHTMITDTAKNGMSVMAMAAHTGCNTVYGSTPPNNPHPYPWMNSLFQDGATIGWIIGESFIKDHTRMSVVPERLVDFILADFKSEDGVDIKFTEDDYFYLTRLSDTQMTDLEVSELPKVWVIGGDGGMGDIGYQNVSKAVLQNRPNVNMLMLDTQVYSNTGGQNSDSSPMTGGFDMNQAGAGSEGKLTEKKSVAESFLGGHGSPFVAQVSGANVGTLYKSILDGLCYRGTSFYQVFTTCQPEHGVPDYAAQIQALRIRDSRGMPEFVFNPQLGETYQETLQIKGNTAYNLDWVTKYAPVTKEKYLYIIPHWAFTENRFRLHHKKVNEEDIKDLIRLEAKLQLVMMDDIVNRRYLNKSHRSYIPDFGVYAVDYKEDGSKVYHSLSRQMVLFCVERRKAWRILQSRAGVENKDYILQKELLAKIDVGELTVDSYMNEMAQTIS